MIRPDALLDGRYRLEEKIGAGGAGEVWRARHVTLNSIVAIKVLHVGASHRELAKKRFLQEARVTAQLRIRQAVQVHDFGFVGERPYLVMELLDGETLKARLAQAGRLTVRQTTMILRQAARALERAHAMGIIHRDFKPDNVFVLQDEDGEEDVRVVDFGIAKLVGGFEEEEEEPPPSDWGHSSGRNVLMNFTRTGSVLGTPYYMAPEQVQSAPDLGPEVDIWAFGVVAYECLTGKRPFDGENAGLLFKAILDAEHVAPHELDPELPAAFSTWFRTACAPDPADRFSDVRTAVATLEEALGVLPVVGPSWLEATNPSMALRAARRSSLPGEALITTGATASSLAGTATEVSGNNSSRRRVAVVAGALLLGAAVVVGVVAGLRSQPSEAASESAPPKASVLEPSAGTTPADSGAEVPVAPPVASSSGLPAVASSAPDDEEAAPLPSRKPRPKRAPHATSREAPKATATTPPAGTSAPTAAPPPTATATATGTATKPPPKKPPSPLDLPPLGI